MLADARTVTILVHGVGDHTPVDIAESVFADRLSGDRITTFALEDLPFPPASSLTWRGRTANSGEAFRIDTAEGVDIILPIAWAHFRVRAESWPSQAGPTSGMMMLPLIGAAILSLSWDLLRCVPKAARWWKIPVGILAVVLPAIFMWLYVEIRMTLEGFQPWRSAIPPIVFIALAVAIAFSIRAFAMVIDFVADVARYVGSAGFRNERESDLANVFRYVRARAPHSSILVVSHSLGTVLSSHTLARSAVIDAIGQVDLITMGSPLVMMAKVFPGSILSPDQLLERYSYKPGVSWTNLWRDSDPIGKALSPTQSGRFSEGSIGQGGHSNYWSDIRVWQAIHNRISAAPALKSVASSVLPTVPAPPPADVQVAEPQPSANRFDDVRLKLLVLRFFWMPIVATAYAWDFHTLFVRPAGPTAFISTLTAMRGLCVSGFMILLVAFSTSFPGIGRGDANRDVEIMEAAHRTVLKMLMEAFLILLLTGLWRAPK